MSFYLGVMKLGKKKEYNMEFYKILDYLMRSGFSTIFLKDLDNLLSSNIDARVLFDPCEGAFFSQLNLLLDLTIIRDHVIQILITRLQTNTSLQDPSLLFNLLPYLNPINCNQIKEIFQIATKNQIVPKNLGIFLYGDSLDISKDLTLELNRNILVDLLETFSHKNGIWKWARENWNIFSPSEKAALFLSTLSSVDDTSTLLAFLSNIDPDDLGSEFQIVLDSLMGFLRGNPRFLDALRERKVKSGGVAYLSLLLLGHVGVQPTDPEFINGHTLRPLLTNPNLFHYTRQLLGHLLLSKDTFLNSYWISTPEIRSEMIKFLINQINTKHGIIALEIIDHIISHEQNPDPQICSHIYSRLWIHISDSDMFTNSPGFELVFSILIRAYLTSTGIDPTQIPANLVIWVKKKTLSDDIQNNKKATIATIMLFRHIRTEDSRDLIRFAYSHYESNRNSGLILILIDGVLNVLREGGWKESWIIDDIVLPAIEPFIHPADAAKSLSYILEESSTIISFCSAKNTVPDILFSSLELWEVLIGEEKDKEFLEIVQAPVETHPDTLELEVGWLSWTTAKLVDRGKLERRLMDIGNCLLKLPQDFAIRNKHIQISPWCLSIIGKKAPEHLINFLLSETIKILQSSKKDVIEDTNALFIREFCASILETESGKKRIRGLACSLLILLHEEEIPETVKDAILDLKSPLLLLELCMKFKYLDNWGFSNLQLLIENWDGEIDPVFFVSLGTRLCGQKDIFIFNLLLMLSGRAPKEFSYYERLLTRDQAKIQIAKILFTELCGLFRVPSSTLLLSKSFYLLVSHLKSDKSSLRFCIHQSNVFLEAFIRFSIPELRENYQKASDTVLKTLKYIQQTTRQLQSICSCTKHTHNRSSAIPRLKRTMERLLFLVKSILSTNGDTSLYWIGNLKHRSIQGDEISSQFVQI